MEFTPDLYTSFDYLTHFVSPDGTRFMGSYALSGEAGQRLEFTDILLLPPGWTTENGRLLAKLLFLASGLRYYKTASPGRIRVAGELSDDEHHFLTMLIKHGMAEFAYRNDLPGALTPSIEAERSSRSMLRDETWSFTSDPLVPIGGGKDSVVTLESLKSVGMSPVAFAVNWVGRTNACINVSGCRSVHVASSADPKLPALNQAGAYNGHIPITAIRSIIALMVADTLGLGPVVMSNERSADYGSLDWHDLDINHQWSKSMVFETLLRDLLGSNGMNPDRYFSLLRPMTELAITKQFSQMPEYFNAFRSCNWRMVADRGADRMPWCGRCPKCRFVFLAMAPFVSPDVLTKIVGENLLVNDDNRKPYREILGLDGYKPFDCVGNYDECALAWTMAASRPEWASSALVRDLAEEIEAAGRAPTEAEALDLLTPRKDHNVPSAFNEALAWLWNVPSTLNEALARLCKAER